MFKEVVPHFKLQNDTNKCIYFRNIDLYKTIKDFMLFLVQIFLIRLRDLPTIDKN